MLDWIRRVNLLWMFVLLFGLHGVLYYSLGTANWLTVALSASLVDSGIIAALQLLLSTAGKQKGK